MNGPLVTVKKFGSSVEAEMAKNALEAEGIAAYVMGGTAGDMLWYAGPTIAGVDLQVAESHAERALRILGRHAVDDEEIDDYGLDPRPQPVIRQTAADDRDHDEDAIESDKDAVVRRAWRAAILGLILCPPLLNLYSLWTLAQLSAAKGALSEAGRRRMVAAVVVDTLTVIVAGLIFITFGPCGLSRL